jgi:hypothetical protein
MHRRTFPSRRLVSMYRHLWRSSLEAIRYVTRDTLVRARSVRAALCVRGIGEDALDDELQQLGG